MLNILNNYELQDYLRQFQGYRGFGTQIAPANRPLQIQGAYSVNRTIIYFVAHQIDEGNTILSTFVIETDVLKYEDGQYLIDNTKLYGANLDYGTYYFEFNNGFETFYSQIFMVAPYSELAKCSSSNLISGTDLISAVNITMNGFLPAFKQFTDLDYVQFAE